MSASKTVLKEVDGASLHRTMYCIHACKHEIRYADRRINLQESDGICHGLPDAVLGNVLSYLFSSEKTNWKEAIHEFNNINRLNKASRRHLNSSIFPALRCSLNLLEFSCPTCVFNTLISLAKARIKIDALHLNGGYHDFDLLAVLMLLHFDTSNIQSLSIILPQHPIPSRYIQPDISHEFKRQSSDEVCDVEYFINIPAEFSKLSLSGFLDKCKFRSLTTLTTMMQIHPNDWDSSFDSIFQIPTLRKLDLTMNFVSKSCQVFSPSLYALSERISRMGNLEELTLRAFGPANFEQYGLAFMNSFFLRSNTLRIVCFQKLPRGFFLRDCVCPKLEHFTCSKSLWGNGVRPDDPAVVMNRDFSAPDGIYTVGSNSFFGMNVPSTCVVFFR